MAVAIEELEGRVLQQTAADFLTCQGSRRTTSIRHLQDETAQIVRIESDPKDVEDKLNGKIKCVTYVHCIDFSIYALGSNISRCISVIHLLFDYMLCFVMFRLMLCSGVHQRYRYSRRRRHEVYSNDRVNDILQRLCYMSIPRRRNPIQHKKSF